MPSNRGNLTVFSFIISKLIFTIMVGVLFFNYDISNVGENNTTILYNNLMQISNNDTSISDNHTTQNDITPHYSAQTGSATTGQDTNYEKICNENLFFCNAIDISNIRDMQKAQDYKLITITTLAQIDAIIVKPYRLAQSLHHITLKQEDIEKRGYANHNNIVLNINKLGYKEYMQVLTHELGHIVDLGSIVGFNKKKDSLFTEFGKEVFSSDDISLLFYALSRNSEDTRKTNADKKDFCTIYAMSSPFEDFAECFNLYLYHNSYFNYIKKSSTILDKKYTIMANLFNNKYLAPDSFVPTKKSIESRERDSTKI